MKLAPLDDTLKAVLFVEIPYPTRSGLGMIAMGIGHSRTTTLS